MGGRSASCVARRGSRDASPREESVDCESLTLNVMWPFGVDATRFPVGARRTHGDTGDDEIEKGLLRGGS